MIQATGKLVFITGLLIIGGVAVRAQKPQVTESARIEDEIKQKQKEIEDLKKLKDLYVQREAIDAQIKQLAPGRSITSDIAPVAVVSTAKTGSEIGAVGSGSDQAESVTRNDGKPTYPQGEFSRVIVGYEQVGASSAGSTVNPFLDLFISVPVSGGNRERPRFRAWGDVRLTSSAQQVQSLSTTANSFISNGTLGSSFSTNTNAVIKAFEFTGGVQYRLGTSRQMPDFLGGSKQRFTTSLLLGGGFTSPLSPIDSVEQFTVTADAQARFGLPPSKTVIAFVNPDRDRFLRQYFAGVRFQTYYFDKDKSTPLETPPATLDLTLGQNEAVTQRLRGAVVRLEGFYPLPFEQTKFIYLFGTALLRLGRAHIDNNPLILQPANPTLTLTDPALAIVSRPISTRDNYRIGLGINLLQLVKTLQQKNQAAIEPTINEMPESTGVEGSSITITGANLGTITEVRIGNAMATIVPPQTATSITVKLPTPTTGIITVRGPGVKATSKGNFTITPKSN